MLDGFGAGLAADEQAVVLIERFWSILIVFGKMMTTCCNSCIASCAFLSKSMD